MSLFPYVIKSLKLKNFVDEREVDLDMLTYLF